jgi:hypothetical protein
MEIPLKEKYGQIFGDVLGCPPDVPRRRSVGLPLAVRALQNGNQNLMCAMIVPGMSSAM